MKRGNRLYGALLCLLLLCPLVMTAFADIGPKPSVHITFENGAEGKTFYGTLLSEQPSTGPATAYETLGEKTMLQDHYCAEGPEAEAVWQAFRDYAEEDDFYFLQCWWSCGEENTLDWTYYPPTPFKLLLWDPDTGAYRAGPVSERYAFDSYYTVDLSGEGELRLERSYDYTWELVSFLIRAALTVLLELAVAWLFGYRERRPVRFIALTNVITQLGLNAALNLINYYRGSMAFVFWYVLLELAVFAVEAALYAAVLPRCSREETGRGRAVSYALVSNALSFGAGLFLAHLIPGIF